ncbi:tRNA lysidine(34) synthetase TilS [Spirosoma rhododendri]|uniref:tRNA(Ile)-lysidine synthase n=1 Tax=Spirosoma rhododendri TaxID=2728024 RepID=A0A7L5DNT4_9BACT|nr:tRNA lysidine(34) synthetase TilS [Spirosoma rhododendri]QJD80066.1 tRNA lysidine(34) synthetase TilS [Spirosoma rhododendri]
MFEQDFLGFINDNKLVDTTGRTLLAVSGGLDSTVMANLFSCVNLPFAIAHVNFGLRGTDSDEDARFVEQLAGQYGVPFHLTRFDTAQWAAEQGVSIQMAARDLRYQWFGSIRQQYSYSRVATAHHLNDVLETMLLNLTRGTGLAGLHGIAVRQEHAQVGTLIRPLLFAHRDQLVTYAQANGLTHREDRSNADDYYARNRIRHHVIPTLTGLNPGLWQTLPRTVERLRAAEQLMQLELTRSWRQLTQTEPDGTIRVPIRQLMELDEGVFRLTEWLRPFGFTPEQVRQIWATLEREPGGTFDSATYRIVRERQWLLLSLLKVTPLTGYKSDLQIIGSGAVISLGDCSVRVDVIERSAEFVPDAELSVAWLDADRLAEPLTLRIWQHGDRFRPLGLAGTKLVSDLLNDLKLEQRDRAQTLVLLSGHDIAWVVGRRIAHRFRVRPDTRRLVRLTQIQGSGPAERPPL